ncbi:vacuolar protein sorting-associated protein 33A [Phakopsora pachyrhizi]|uniref:Vacuolar protein sorting-associated protein 33A n=1 Tax=Phakopsora pachyrhizi TaxID=170000 RepID=A0AAV0BP61_PHAPC|nr:vacuolar protein sorting-associated protein 33A [Phakopsora pachyrhizi]CAH7688814.1 vacuolar protein sorting-associated protein 33A [Phakopsora pachyrhizi]
MDSASNRASSTTRSIINSSLPASALDSRSQSNQPVGSSSTATNLIPLSSHLTSLDFSIFKTYCSRSLTDQLDEILGPKSIIIDPTLAGPLGLVTQVNNLKEHGVDKLFWLESGPIGNAGMAKSIVWVTKANIRAMRIISEQILSIPTRSSHNFTILIAPRSTQICRNVLSDAGVFGSVRVKDFDMSFVQLERDLFSLEEDFGGYSKIFADGDLGPIYNMAKSIMNIQRAYGLIPRIIGKGVAARKLANLLHRLRSEHVSSPGHGASIPKLTPGSIDSLIILDRHLDMVTPMCTQLTYEGLLDELIGIEHAHIEVAPDLLAPSTPVAGNTAHSIPSSSTSQTFPQTTKRKKYLLNSLSDPLFCQLRDHNFAMVGSCLNRIAKRINMDYERRNEARTVQQVKEFVGRLAGLQNEHQALRLHTGLSEQIMTTTTSDEFHSALEIQQNLVAGLDLSGQERAIGQLIDQELPFRTILRLLCLYSLVLGGIKPKVLENFQREILQTYGYHHLNLLISLSSLSLLSPITTGSSSTVPLSIMSGMVGSKSSFANARKVMKLISDEVDEAEPTDISYTFSGYAPLSVRFVEAAFSNDSLGWKGSVEEILKSFPGDAFDERQSSGEQPVLQESPLTTIVCFLGGITFGEVSSLRFSFNQKKMKGRKLVILTTGIVNGSSILRSLMPVETRGD